MQHASDSYQSLTKDGYAGQGKQGVSISEEVESHVSHACTRFVLEHRMHE
jgi:hypothetical protein